MKSLLAIEWLKIKQYRTFWVLIGLFAILFPLWNFGVNSGWLRLGTANINLLGSSFTFGAVWTNVGAYASNFVIFLAILIAILITNEYNFKTNRQNVIDGWSKMQFYHAKWIGILVLAALTTVFVFLTGIVMGISKGADWGGFSANIIKMLWMFILSVNYFGLAMLLSHLVKRSGLAISLLVIYSMMIEFILHLVFFFKQWFTAELFLPLQCSDQLLQISSIEQLQKMGLQHATFPPDWQYAVAAICWISLYYILGRILLLRRDW